MSLSIQNVYRFFLMALLFNAIGLGLELYFIEHFENTKQWIPIVALLVSMLAFIMIFLLDNPIILRFYIVVMGILIAAGLLGIYFHLEENYEFAMEMYPSANTNKLIKETLEGATPALAPGSLTGLGLFGLVYYLIKRKNLTNQ